jgi:hypothetical protein
VRFFVHLYCVLLNDCPSPSAVYQRNPHAQFSSLEVVIIGVCRSFSMIVLILLCFVNVCHIQSSEKSVPLERKVAHATSNRQ